MATHMTHVIFPPCQNSAIIWKWWESFNCSFHLYISPPLRYFGLQMECSITAYLSKHWLNYYHYHVKCPGICVWAFELASLKCAGPFLWPHQLFYPLPQWNSIASNWCIDKQPAWTVHGMAFELFHASILWRRAMAIRTISDCENWVCVCVCVIQDLTKCKIKVTSIRFSNACVYLVFA